ncbi:MAG TPA: UPF0149 family protein [Terriglobales bacterium]|nr:UPF0149 family protein [Terriglobales bacterium]
MPRRMLAETKAACGWFHMKTFTQNDPLTDAELDRLGDFLKSCKGGRAMNVEALDGFFAALIAGPETVMPSEYYREVFGGEMSDACEFGSLDEANEILGLMMRHWNDIAGTLNKDEVYGPILLQDENGVFHGNDWARGFMRGMGMRSDGWAELMDDEEHGGCLIAAGRRGTDLTFSGAVDFYPVLRVGHLLSILIFPLRY